MTNHVHLALKTDDLETLSQFAYFTQRRYAYYYFKTYRWSEQVFRRNFGSIPINNDTYLLECARYIERNPLKAKLVKDLKDYSYSSYAFYAFGKRDNLISESPIYSSLGRSRYERMAAYRWYVNHQRVELKKME